MPKQKIASSIVKKIVTNDRIVLVVLSTISDIFNAIIMQTCQSLVIAILSQEGFKTPNLLSMDLRVYAELN